MTMTTTQLKEFIEKLEKTLINYQSRYTILKEKFIEETNIAEEAETIKK